MYRLAVGRGKLTVCVKGNSRKIHSDTCVFGWGRGGLYKLVPVGTV